MFFCCFFFCFCFFLFLFLFLFWSMPCISTERKKKKKKKEKGGGDFNLTYSGVQRCCMFLFFCLFFFFFVFFFFFCFFFFFSFLFFGRYPVSILYKSTAGRYRPVRVADGPITARCRFIKNASWVYF